MRTRNANAKWKNGKRKKPSSTFYILKSIFPMWIVNRTSIISILSFNSKY